MLTLHHARKFARRFGPGMITGASFAGEHLARIKLDTFVGMAFSNAIAFCVMLATAITLNQNGITDIQTTKQAAEALRPLAGEFTFVLFALGVISTGMLAVPVLAASAGYAVADTFGWRSRLDHDVLEAKGFFGVIAVPIMAVMMGLGSNPEILGKFTLSRRHRVLGWFATAVMAAAVIAMIIAG